MVKTIDWIKAHWLSVLLLLLIAVGWTCYACQPAPKPDVPAINGVPYTGIPNIPTDTIASEKLVRTHVTDHAKGYATQKHIVFQGSILTPSGIPGDSTFVIYHDTLNLADTTLASDITTVLPVDVPIVVKRVTVPVADRSSNWTFAEIGAAVGSLVLIVFLFLIHIL